MSLRAQARHGHGEPRASAWASDPELSVCSSPAQSGLGGRERASVPLESQPTFQGQGPPRSFQEPIRQQECPGEGALQGLRGPALPAPSFPALEELGTGREGPTRAALQP